MPDRIGGPNRPVAPVAPSAPGDVRPTPNSNPTPTSPVDVFGLPAAVTTLNALSPEAMQRLMANAGENVALVPGRYPNAVGLPDVLRAASASPQGRAMVDKLAADITAKTGVEVPPALKEAALRDPAVLTRAMELSPAAMSRGMDAVNAAYRAGRIQQIAERKHVLPQKFDLANAASIPYERPQPKMKELAPGLFQGDLPGTTPDAQLKSNVLTAEVFQRLSENSGKADGAKFSVNYGDSTFTRLDNFLDALKKDGHEVSVSFEQRVANFSNLKTVVPGSNPPKFLDVPAPLLIKTGIHDANGAEAVVPAVHAEMVVHIRKGADTKGPGVDADIKFYQGISGTGFFPVGSSAEPAWCGKAKNGELTGDAAMKAVSLAGLFTDVVQDAAKSLNLYMGGYGITGVCNDSVAVIQQAMTGSTTMYPLLMRDSVLTQELDKRLSDGVRRDDPAYRSLLESIKALPSDTEMTPTTQKRALSALPWEPGKEPLKSSEAARRILEG